MNLTAKIFLILGCYILGTLLYAQNRDVDVKYRLAQSYERSGDLESAAKIYEELYKKDSTNVVLADALRRAYLQLKRYDDVIVLLNHILRRSPNDIVTLSQLGSAYVFASKEKKAFETWEQAIAVDPKHDGTYRLVANAMSENRMFDHAIEVFKRGRVACGDSNLFTLDIAFLYTAMLNYAEATREYVRMISQNPGQLGYVQSRIASYTGRSDGLSAATRTVEEIQKKEPSNITLQQLLAWLFMEGKHFDRAYDVYTSIDASTNAGGHELYNFAERALREKAYSAAAKAFQDVMAKFPKFDLMPQVKFGYARTLEESAAEHNTLTSSAAHPSHPETEAAPQYTGAVAAYNRVIADYPKTEVAARSLLRIAILKQERFFDLDGARTTMEILLRDYTLFPGITIEAKFRLGDVYLSMGDLTNAETQYRTLIQYFTGGDYRERAAFRLAEIDYFNAKFKDATTKLQQSSRNAASDITNDALKLQIFIQENTQSGDAVLKEFAKAEFLQRQKKLSEALEIYQSIVNSDSSSSLADESLMHVGNILALLQRYQEAITAFERLMNNFPESLVLDQALMNIGQTYQNGLHDKIKAMAAYQQVLEKYPNSIYVSEARKRIRILRGDNI